MEAEYYVARKFLAKSYSNEALGATNETSQYQEACLFFDEYLVAFLGTFYGTLSHDPKVGSERPTDSS